MNPVRLFCLEGDAPGSVPRILVQDGLLFLHLREPNGEVKKYRNNMVKPLVLGRTAETWHYRKDGSLWYYARDHQGRAAMISGLGGNATTHWRKHTELKAYWQEHNACQKRPSTPSVTSL